MAGNLQPLDQQFQIVDAQGRPTIYFIQWAQQRQIDIGGALTLEDLQQYLEDNHLSTVQEILDQITTTRGSILYRGAAGWAALAPGTAGQVLQTAGAGADPLWAAAGGGSTVFGPKINVPAVAGFSLLSGDATNLILTNDTDIGIIAVCGAPVAGNITRFAYKTLSNKALAWDYQVAFQGLVPRSGSSSVGLMLRDSIGGQLATFTAFREDGNAGFFRKASLTGGESAIAFSGYPRPWIFGRFVSDGTNLTLYVSVDGKTWAPVYTELLTASCPNKPDQIGFGSTTNHAAGTSFTAFPNLLAINSFSLTGPGV